jgi:uncharacterized membrane protein
MNWYYASGAALICLTIAIPIWTASRVEENLDPGLPPCPRPSTWMVDKDEMSNSEPAIADLARRLLDEGLGCLSAREKRLIMAAVRRKQPATPSVNDTLANNETMGDRIADRVARFGGSWTFILLFIATLIVWVAVNGFLIEAGARAFDPYPFVFLNLILSMVAALQAPIILMSQNRQANRDRVAASLDYDVNLKAEIEIMAVHEKLDGFRIDRLHALIEKQHAMLEELTASGRGPLHPA